MTCFVVKPQYRGQGEAKKYLKSSVETYEKIGIKEVKINASKENGSYVWLKYGFVPDKGDVKRVVKHMKGRLDKLTDVSITIRKELDDMLRGITDGKDFWKIADKQIIRESGETFEIGKNLLLGSEWTGSLNLKDAISMKRFNKYVDPKLKVVFEKQLSEKVAKSEISRKAWEKVVGREISEERAKRLRGLADNPSDLMKKLGVTKLEVNIGDDIEKIGGYGKGRAINFNLSPKEKTIQFHGIDFTRKGAVEGSMVTDLSNIEKLIEGVDRNVYNRVKIGTWDRDYNLQLNEFLQKYGGIISKNHPRRMRLVDDISHGIKGGVGKYKFSRDSKKKLLDILKKEDILFSDFYAVSGLDERERAALRVLLFDRSDQFEIGLDITNTKSVEKFKEGIVAMRAGRFTGWDTVPVDVSASGMSYSRGEWVDHFLFENKIRKNYNPEEFIKGLVPGRKATGDVTLRFDMKKVTLSYSDDIIENYKRRLTADGWVYHDSFVLKKGSRGKGIAKQFLKSSMEVYEKLGMKELVVHADLEAGGYVWAKFGFKPAGGMLEQRGLHSHLHSRLERVDLTKGLSKHVKGNLRSMIDSAEDFEDMWKLADLKVVAEDGELIDMGRELFTGSKWTGSLKLDDAVSMRRFRDYVDPVISKRMKEAAERAVREAARLEASEKAWRKIIVGFDEKRDSAEEIAEFAGKPDTFAKKLGVEKVGVTKSDSLYKFQLLKKRDLFEFKLDPKDKTIRVASLDFSSEGSKSGKLMYQLETLEKLIENIDRSKYKTIAFDSTGKGGIDSAFKQFIARNGGGFVGDEKDYKKIVEVWKKKIDYKEGRGIYKFSILHDDNMRKKLDREIGEFLISDLFETKGLEKAELSLLDSMAINDTVSNGRSVLGLNLNNERAIKKLRDGIEALRKEGKGSWKLVDIGLTGDYIEDTSILMIREKLENSFKTVDEFVDAMVPGAKSDGRVSFLSRGSESLDFRYSDDRVKNLQRRFFRLWQRDDYVEHVRLEIREAFRNKGLAKKIFESQVKAYRKMGINRIKLRAGLEDGAYYWLKYGFKPDKKSIKKIKEKLLSRVKKMKGVLESSRKELERLVISIDDSVDLWRVADATGVGSSGKVKKIGRELLAKEVWEGSLDLNDHISMNRFNSYINPEYAKKAAGYVVSNTDLIVEVEAAKRLNKKIVKVKSQASDGGYELLKLGFVGDDKEWLKLKKHMRKRYNEIEASGRFKYPSKVDIDLFDAVQQEDWVELRESLGMIKIDRDGNEVEIMKEILEGAEWEGFLNLDHKDAVKTFNNYIEDRVGLNFIDELGSEVSKKIDIEMSLGNAIRSHKKFVAPNGKVMKSNSGILSHVDAIEDEKMRSVIREYKYHGPGFNEYKIGDMGPKSMDEYRPKIELLDNAFDFARLEDDITLYRHITKKDIRGIMSKKVGSEFTLKTYTSTSRYMTDELAMIYTSAGERSSRSNPVVQLVIRAKRGNRAIEMEQFGRLGEAETLLPAGSRFRVLSKQEMPLSYFPQTVKAAGNTAITRIEVEIIDDIVDEASDKVVDVIAGRVLKPNKHYPELFIDNLTKDQKFDILAYVSKWHKDHGFGFEEMQSYKRFGEAKASKWVNELTAELREKIRRVSTNFDDAFNYSQLRKDTTLHHFTLAKPGREWGKVRVGDIVEDKGYMSSVLKPTQFVADEYTTGKKVNIPSILVKINAKKGQRAIQAHQIIEGIEELDTSILRDEVILPAGSKFRVKSIKSIQDTEYKKLVFSDLYPFKVIEVDIVDEQTAAKFVAERAAKLEASKKAWKVVADKKAFDKSFASMNALADTPDELAKGLGAKKVDVKWDSTNRETVFAARGDNGGVLNFRAYSDEKRVYIDDFWQPLQKDKFDDSSNLLDKFMERVDSRNFSEVVFEFDDKKFEDSFNEFFIQNGGGFSRNPELFQSEINSVKKLISTKFDEYSFHKKTREELLDLLSGDIRKLKFSDFFEIEGLTDIEDAMLKSILKNQVKSAKLESVVLDLENIEAVERFRKGLKSLKKKGTNSWDFIQMNTTGRYVNDANVELMKKQIEKNYKNVDEFVKEMVPVSGKDKGITFRATNDGGFAFNYTDDRIEQIERYFYYNKNEVENVNFTVREPFRNKGIAKEVVKSQIEAYKKLGVKKITLRAGLEDGAYYWLKYGFKPDRDEIKSVIREMDISRNVDKGFQKHFKLTDQQVELLRKRVRGIKDPEDFWKLADLEYVNLEGDKFKPGKHLLRELEWDGSLDLEDAVAMKRFNVYTDPKFAAAEASKKAWSGLIKGSVESLPDDVVRKLNNFSEDPDDFVKAFIPDYDGKGKLELKYGVGKYAPGKKADGGYISLSYSSPEIDDYVRVIDLERNFVDHEHFQVNKAFRGKGIAKKYLKSSVEAYKKFGFEKVAVEAGWDDGAYTWLKYGFKPSKGSFNYNRNKFLEAIKTFKGLSENSRKKLQNILEEMKDPSDFWKIADAIGIDEKGDIEEIGKVFLHKKSWEGSLDLTDPISMKRFENYVDPVKSVEAAKAAREAALIAAKEAAEKAAKEAAEKAAKEAAEKAAKEAAEKAAKKVAIPKVKVDISTDEGLVTNWVKNSLAKTKSDRLLTSLAANTSDEGFVVGEQIRKAGYFSTSMERKMKKAMNEGNVGELVVLINKNLSSKQKRIFWNQIDLDDIVDDVEDIVSMSKFKRKYLQKAAKEVSEDVVEEASKKVVRKAVYESFDEIPGWKKLDKKVRNKIEGEYGRRPSRLVEDAVELFKNKEVSKSVTIEEVLSEVYDRRDFRITDISNRLRNKLDTPLALNRKKVVDITERVPRFLRPSSELPDEFFDNFTEEMRKELDTYGRYHDVEKGYGFQEIQSFKRTGEAVTTDFFGGRLTDDVREKIKKTVKVLDEAFENSVTRKDLTRYRFVVAKDGYPLKNVKVGQVVTEGGGYLSTSRNLSGRMSRSFTMGASKKNPGMLLKIDMKKGQKAIEMSQFFEGGDAIETLLPAGTKFRVKAVFDDIKKSPFRKNFGDFNYPVKVVELDIIDDAEYALELAKMKAAKKVVIPRVKVDISTDKGLVTNWVKNSLAKEKSEKLLSSLAANASNNSFTVANDIRKLGYFSTSMERRIARSMSDGDVGELVDLMQKNLSSKQKRTFWKSIDGVDDIVDDIEDIVSMSKLKKKYLEKAASEVVEEVTEEAAEKVVKKAAKVKLDDSVTKFKEWSKRNFRNDISKKLNIEKPVGNKSIVRIRFGEEGKGLTEISFDPKSKKVFWDSFDMKGASKATIQEHIEFVEDTFDSLKASGVKKVNMRVMNRTLSLEDRGLPFYTEVPDDQIHVQVGDVDKWVDWGFKPVNKTEHQLGLKRQLAPPWVERTQLRKNHWDYALNTKNATEWLKHKGSGFRGDLLTDKMFDDVLKMMQDEDMKGLVKYIDKNLSPKKAGEFWNGISLSELELDLTDSKVIDRFKNKYFESLLKGKKVPKVGVEFMQVSDIGIDKGVKGYKTALSTTQMREMKSYVGIHSDPFNDFGYREMQAVKRKLPKFRDIKGEWFELPTHKLKDIERTMEVIDEAFDYMRLDEDDRLYRFFNLYKGSPWEKAKVGQVIKHPGYTSTARFPSKEVAELFTRGASKESQPIMLVVNVEKGQRILEIEHISKLGEAESVLPAGTKFKIKKIGWVEKGGGMRYDSVNGVRLRRIEVDVIND